MTPEQAKALRVPFPADVVGKLPRVWCGDCRNARSKVCDKHARVKCGGCNGNLTTAHLHLDYVGHAEVTDRLLAVDPEWTWEPVAFGPNGLPTVDQAGGLWIRLTVAGVTRLGYGHADGKTGPDAVKESIGDALRNAAMRFGVALDLWGAKFKEPDDDPAEPEQPRRQADQPANPEPPTAGQPRTAPAAGAPMVTETQHKRMHANWRALGFDGDHNRDLRLQLTSKFIDRGITSSTQLTAAEADTVIERQEARRAELREQGARRAEHAGAAA